MGTCCPDSRLLAADHVRGFDAIHLRHLHIHQDQIERLRPPRLYARPPVGGHDHLVARILQDGRGQLLIHHAVFDQQDAQRVRRCEVGHGSSGGGDGGRLLEQ